ncbi:NfeD family protein [Brevibacillus ginsengisoli]|uniref:NfeD family protein n=1 Tax=Brevibacillus ginsengisoli TaxID=363854 RepID=UPI003CFB440A
MISRLIRTSAWALIVCFAIGLLLVPFQQAVQAQSSKHVFVIPVKQGIERGLESFLQRALSEAHAQGADTIVLDIDTPGGEIGAAGEIGRMVRENPAKVVAYIDNQAFSAGTYIALNANQIVMTPGSSMGSAAPINLQGNTAGVKVISAWSEMMAGAAKMNHRDPDIARAMVELDKEIPGVKSKGSVLSLDATKALEVGYADKIVKDKQGLYQFLGVHENEVKEIDPTLSEKVARFVTSPAVMSVLFIIGLVGMVVELFVPGFGVFGTISILSFGLYFFGHFVAGFASWLDIGLFVLGILLMILEIFLPGAIIGIIGFVCLVTGIVLSAYNTEQGLISLGMAVIIAVIVGYVLAKYFGHRGLWNKFILQTEQHNAEGYVAPKDQRRLIDQQGIALTPLRPAGIVRIHTDRVDAVSVGGFIAAGTPIVVVQVEGNRVVVQEQEMNMKE